MIKKELGKITSAEFGTDMDYPYLFGLELSFSMSGSAISTGGKYRINIEWSESSNYLSTERDQWLSKNMKDIHQILQAAKVNKVSELVGLPVEIEIEENTFKTFRILTEVL